MLCPPSYGSVVPTTDSRTAKNAGETLRLLPEAAVDPAYSIISSARTRSVGGTSRPSVLAVARLIASANWRYHRRVAPGLRSFIAVGDLYRALTGIGLLAILHRTELRSVARVARRCAPTPRIGRHGRQRPAQSWADLDYDLAAGGAACIERLRVGYLYRGAVPAIPPPAGPGVVGDRTIFLGGGRPRVRGEDPEAQDARCDQYCTAH